MRVNVFIIVANSLNYVLPSSSLKRRASCLKNFLTTNPPPPPRMKTTPLRSNNSGVVPMPTSSPDVQKGNYADPFGPVASSPRGTIKLPPRREIKIREAEQVNVQDASWTSALLSPVLKLFGGAEDGNTSALSGASFHSATSTTPVVAHTQPSAFSSQYGGVSPTRTSTPDTTNTYEGDSLESKSVAMEEEIDLEIEEPSNTTHSSSQHQVSYEFDPFIFMAQLPPHHEVKHNVHDPRPLPPLHDLKKPTLILDLDETLVHCSADGSGQYDVTFGVHFNGVTCQVFVRKRPHLELFLERVSALYEVTVFTASQRVYAERLLDILDPQGRWIRHRLYRESCLMVSGNLLKDLSILNRDLSRTVIVDNSPHAFAYQIDNGIPIESWYDDPNDVELLKLLPLLERLHRADDVRPHLRNVFGMNALVDEARFR